MSYKHSGELFILAKEDALHPFVVEQRLRRYDDLISRYEDDLEMWLADYESMVETEVGMLHDEDDFDEEDVESFDDTFRDLSCIDGIYPVEYFDRVVSMAEMIEAEKRA